MGLFIHIYHMYIHIHVLIYIISIHIHISICMHMCVFVYPFIFLPFESARRGGGLGSRPKKMYGERLGDGVEYHLMKPTPRR